MLWTLASESENKRLIPVVFGYDLKFIILITANAEGFKTSSHESEPRYLSAVDDRTTHIRGVSRMVAQR